MKSVFVGASLLALSSAQQPDYKSMWDQFKKDYHKSYPSDGSNGNSEQERFEIFKSNVDTIESHNAKKLSYWLGVNEFADQTWEEFSSTHLGYKPESRVSTLPKVPFPNITDVADAVDWVAKGAVTPVKNQQRCGSCWAFSSTGSLEGAFFVATGKLQSLSEEDLVQCNSVTDHGCQGGLMDNAFEWVQQNGICSEDSYPYTSGSGITGSCKKTCKPIVTITGHTDVPSKDETSLKAAVSKQPVSVAIEADKSAFQLYRGGVLDNPACGTQLDHGVLIVGYGTDSGKDYWKVKNSWGATWGEQGYIRMARNKNQCGIAQQPSYPTGAKSEGPSPPPSPPSPPSPPTPPAPPSPPSGSHYEDPKGGCRSDEIDIQIQGVQGAVCSPSCTLGIFCPKDVPTGVTARPTCALQDSSTQKKYCALICTPGADDNQCGENASCKSIQGVGICTYDDDKDSAKRETVKYVGSEIVV
jgi:C1A family cysteine protease